MPDAIACDRGHRTRVTQPRVVDRFGDQLDRVAADLRRRGLLVRGVDDEQHGFEAGDGVRDERVHVTRRVELTAPELLPPR